MKKGLVISGPDVVYGPLALLCGSFEEKIQRAAELGYDGVELMVRDPAKLDWSSIRRAIEAVNLEVPQIVTGEIFGADGLCLVTADEDLYLRTKKRLFDVIDLASYLGAMVNIGRVRGRLDLLGKEQNARAIALDRLSAVVGYAATCKVKINLEPLNRYECDFILSASDGRQFVDDLDYENVGLMLDVFHMNIEEITFEHGFQQAGDRLWHVHIADSNRRYPGSAHLDFEAVFTAIKRIDYQGYVSAELLPWPDPDTAAQKTIEFLRYFEKKLGG